MSSKVYSAAVVGVDASGVEIEVDAGWGPEGRIAVVGLPDTAAKESRDRVLSALSKRYKQFRIGFRCLGVTFHVPPSTPRKVLRKKELGARGVRLPQ